MPPTILHGSSIHGVSISFLDKHYNRVSYDLGTGIYTQGSFLNDLSAVFENNHNKYFY